MTLPPINLINNMQDIFCKYTNLLTLTESLSSLYADFTIASILSLFKGCLYKLGDILGFSNSVFPLLPGIFTLLIGLSGFLFIMGLCVCVTLGMEAFCFKGKFLPGFVPGVEVGMVLWAISCIGT